MFSEPCFGEFKAVGRGVILHEDEIRIKKYSSAFCRLCSQYRSELIDFPLLLPEQTKALFMAMKATQNTTQLAFVVPRSTEIQEVFAAFLVTWTFQ